MYSAHIGLELNEEKLDLCGNYEHSARRQLAFFNSTKVLIQEVTDLFFIFPTQHTLSLHI